MRETASEFCLPSSSAHLIFLAEINEKNREASNMMKLYNIHSQCTGITFVRSPLSHGSDEDIVVHSCTSLF